MAIFRIIALILAETIDLNFSNFTNEGILRVAFSPYLTVLGNSFWGALFGFIGVALYANERSVGVVTLYLILIGIFISIVFPESLMGIFSLILAFALGVIFYKAFVQKREF
jgi:hypothetical protein